MKSKWVFNIEGLSNYIIGEDKSIYRKPYTELFRSYWFRKIKKQYPNRYRLNGRWWSESQLKAHIFLDKNPIEISKENNLPF
jgi:hypothetical protein